MILAIDIHYTQNSGFAAGVTFEDWQSQNASGEFFNRTDKIENYVSGEFYRRELPCILNLLNEHHLQPSTIIVDGYVFLDNHQKPGLGKRLHDALENDIAIIGVAKKEIVGISEDTKIYRGKSQQPLFITTTEKNLTHAKNNIVNMFGEYRIPYLLKQADQLSRRFCKTSS